MSCEASSSDKSSKNAAISDGNGEQQKEEFNDGCKSADSSRKLNFSAKEFVSRGAHGSSKSPLASASSSSLAPSKFSGAHMLVPSPTYASSQSWIVENLSSLISSNQDDEASENEMPHGTSSGGGNQGSKMLKTDHGRSPMQSIGNFDEIERARRERYEPRFHNDQHHSGLTSHALRSFKESDSFSTTDTENQNELAGYVFSSTGGSAFYEEKFSKRPFSPDEIHELTPQQQLHYQIQQERQQKSQQQSFYFQHADGLDYDQDVNMLTDYYQGHQGKNANYSNGQRQQQLLGVQGMGMESGGEMTRKSMFRSSSSSKLPQQPTGSNNYNGNNNSNIVSLNERKQKSLIRLNSEQPPLPSSSSTGGLSQAEIMNPSSFLSTTGSAAGRNRMPNKSPSDNNLLAYFKQNNQAELAFPVQGYFHPRKSAQGYAPNIYVSQAANVPEFIPKSLRLAASSSQQRRSSDFEAVNDFNNNMLNEGVADFGSGSLMGEPCFSNNPYANRRNYPQYLSQRMQSSRHSVQMSDLQTQSFGMTRGGLHVPGQTRHSMANALEPEMMTHGLQSHQGLRKMARSSSSLLYQGGENCPFPGRQFMNDSNASSNLDDSMFAPYHQQQHKWQHQMNHGNSNNGRKWMQINQQQQQQGHQYQGQQMMNQQARDSCSRSMSMVEQEDDHDSQSQQQQQQHQQDHKDPIVLHVKNLDYKISADEWKRILLENFRKHCKEIISVSVVTNPDKSLLGVVKLGTKEDTRLAISCLHHKKIGYKRLNVQIASSSSSNSPKSKVVALLKSSGADNGEMPLTRFIESFEARYNQSITISELFKLKDTVYISHGRDGQGRQIKLIGNKNHQYNLENEMQELLHTPFCSLHSSQKHDEFSMKEMVLVKAAAGHLDRTTTSMNLSHHQNGLGWLPNVVVSLRTFKSAVHKLLNDHGGQMSLLSFLDCYRCCIYNDAVNNSASGSGNASNTTAASGKTAETANDEDGGQLSYQLVIDNENGVPLEHLITCAQDVQIQYNEGFYKQLQWENDKSKSANLQSRNNNSSTSNLCALLNSTSNRGSGGGRAFEMSESVWGFDEETMVEESQRKVNMFSHEVVELFKSVSRCVIPVSKFNTEYNKKYGRQCRVADYGFTKLQELLESIPHILQILDGEYEKKLTLTHRIQVRRFSNDVLKVLKSHPAKQMFADEYPGAYEKHFGRTFDIRDYGVCFLEDMLAELPDTIVCRKEIEGRTFIQIPRVVQMDEEVLCTKRLANDVIDMLRHKPRFSIQFNKFIPNYHHHFGRQCKLSNYGFTKLVELLEAMPNVVQLLVKDGLQFVQLKPHLMMDLICQNIVKLVEDSACCKLVTSLLKLEELYNSKYEAIYFKDLECSSFVGLFKKLPFEKHFVQLRGSIPGSNDGQTVEVDLIAQKQVFLDKPASDETKDASLELTLQVDAINENLVKRVARLTLKRLIDDEMDNYLAKHLQASTWSGKSLVSFDELVQLLFYADTTSQSEMDITSVVSKLQQLNKREHSYLLKLLSDYLQTVGSSSESSPSSSLDNIIGFSDVYYFSKQIRIIFKQINILEMSFADLEMVYKQAMGLTSTSSFGQQLSSGYSGFPHKRLGFIDAYLLFSQGISLLVSVKKFDNDKSIVLNKEFWPKIFDTNPLCLADSLSNPISPINIDLSQTSSANLSGYQNKSQNLSDTTAQPESESKSQKETN